MPLVEVPVQQRCGSASSGLFVCGVWHDAQSGRGDTGETFGKGKVIWYLMLLMLVLHVSLNKRESAPSLLAWGWTLRAPPHAGQGGGKHTGGRAASAFAVQLSNSITEVLAATDPLWNSRSTAAELHENVAASQSQARPFNHHEKGNATAYYYACFGCTHSNPLPARACVTPMKQLITMRCFGKPSEPKTKEDEANN